MRKATIARTLLCLCMILIPLGLSAQGRKVTLSLKDVNLTSALRQVEQQSGYYKINYPSSEVSRYKVNANVKNATAPEAVKTLLKGLPFESSVNGQFIQIKKTNRQEIPSRRVVRGRILDAQGEPLIGVTVQVEGTQKGAITDIDGNYELDDVEEGEQLTYSYVGKRPLKRRASYKPSVIILEEENAMLEDVVVTGYQTISKERAAGSYDIVKGDDITNKYLTSNSLLSSLEGITTGLSVNNSYGADKYLIRGTTSLNSTRTPLYVVDGVPMEGALVEEMINSNDIKSVTLLKDATAASIWGSQAANGVIVITTKRGENNQKAKVSYNGSFTYYGKPDYDYYNYMDNATYMKNAQEMFDLYADTYPYETVTTSNTGLSHGLNYSPAGLPIVFPHEEIMYQYKNGEISASQRDAALQQLISQNGRQQYEDAFMSDKLFTQHNINISGGGEKSNYYLSLNYKGDQGVSKDWTNKFNINAYHDFQFNKWLKWDITLNADWNSQSGHVMPFCTNTGNVMNKKSAALYYNIPYAIFSNTSGLIDYSNYLMTSQTKEDAEALTGIDLSFYPTEDFMNTTNKTVSNNMRINTGITIDLLKGLKYEGRFQYYRGSSKTETFYPATTYQVREEQAMTFNPSTGLLRVPKTGGHFILNNTVSTDWTLRNQLSFDRSFSDMKHQITALAGVEIRSYKVTGFNDYLRGYNMQTMQLETYDLEELNQFSISPAGLGLSAQVRGVSYAQTELAKKYFSMYANAAYTYNSKYIINASMRIDQSNLFGSDPSDQYKPIWAVGAAWKISDEAFMKDITWLNMLKLRASFGLAGNSPEPGTGGKYDILLALGGSTTEDVGYYITTPSNEQLTWEKTRTINLGFDASLFKNRLDIAFDYYNKYTKDLIGLKRLNPTSGWLTTTGNLGEMSNKGFELSLTSHNIMKNDFYWNTNFTLSFNKNKVEKIQVAEPITLAYELLAQSYVEGYPVGALFSYRYAGLNKEGMCQAYDKDGNIVTGSDLDYNMAAEDLVYSGTTIPKFYGGLTNTFSYKNFDLSFMFAYSFGHKMRKESVSYYGRMASNLINEFDNRWRTAGDELYTDVPKYTAEYDYSHVTTPYNYADTRILNASFIKLRDITLSYRLPANLCRKIGTQGIKFTAQVGNLFYIAFNGEGIDPEAYYLSNSSWGSRQDKYPATYSFGINVNF